MSDQESVQALADEIDQYAQKKYPEDWRATIFHEWAARLRQAHASDAEELALWREGICPADVATSRPGYDGPEVSCATCPDQEGCRFRWRPDRRLLEAVRYLLRFLPAWAIEEVPEGLPEMFYGTLSAEGDRQVKRRIDEIRALVERAEQQPEDPTAHRLRRLAMTTPCRGCGGTPEHCPCSACQDNPDALHHSHIGLDGQVETWDGDPAEWLQLNPPEDES